jgi:transposase-like protein
MIVSMCVELYVSSGCGLRSISKIIKYLDSKLGWGLPEIPSYNSIKNWVEKSGYSLYKEPELRTGSQDYAQIVDESIMIGNEKMLLTLGIKAEKTEKNALTLNEVEVLNISVKKSWNGQSIAKVFTLTEEKMGRPPAYIISDNASTISKGIRDKSFIQIRDVSHTLAMFVERQYKNDSSFQAFIKDVSAIKYKEILRPTSYLLPPNQRTIARFMNLSTTIDWAEKILHAFPKLTGEEQEVFGFLHKHTSIITELGELFETINLLSKRLKTEGLSKETIKTSMAELQSLLYSKSSRVWKVAKDILQYLKEEGEKLKDKKTIWHASSDVIESLFGNYKSRKSPNSLNGVTRYVMILPLLTAINTETGTSNLCFKDALESVFLRDLEQWSDDNLTENLTVKRNEILNST